MLTANNLGKLYDNRWAIKNVSFKLKPGSITGLLGRNASGKSTLLRLLAGSSKPTTGECSVFGKTCGPESRIVTSFSPDVDYFYTHLTVGQHLEFYSNFYDSWNWEKCNDILATMELSLKSKITSLSQGQKARLKLTVSFSWDSQLILMDEPFKGIDFPSKQLILNVLLNEYKHEKQTIIISTHNIEESESLFDQILVMNKGKLLVQTNPDELREKYQESLSQILARITE